MIVKCKECGGTHVLLKYWYNPNTDQLDEPCSGEENECWCEDCEDICRCEWVDNEKDWCKLSALLAETSEDKHLKVDICLETEEDMGLSTLQKLHMSEIWQDEKEGIITFKLDGCDDEFDLSDYEEFVPQVVKYLKTL